MSAAAKMSLSDLLFSFEGRIPRSSYWLRFQLPYSVIVVVLIIVDAAIGIGILSVIFSLLALYPSIAVGVKRCHDRNRSGWFLLVAFIPLVNLWLLIELAFLRGTVGANQYGPDPLGEAA